MIQVVRNVDEEAAAVRAGPAWFRPVLISLTVVGVLVRVAFAVSRFGRMLPGDAQFYYGTGAHIAAGQGMEQLSPTQLYAIVPTAQHPPALPALLALVNLVGLGSIDQQHVVASVIAAAAVPLMGLLGRRIAGPAAGIMAAGIAAVSPLWFQPSGILMSESIYLVLIPLVLLLAVDSVERPEVWRFGALGAAIALATLTRSEAIDFIVLLGIPVVLLMSGSWKRRLTVGVVLLAGFGIVLAPWLVRNEIQLGGLALSDNVGGTLAGSYCPSAVDPNEPDYGAWNYTCTLSELTKIQKEKPPAGERYWSEVSADHQIISDTLRYIGSHQSQMPKLIVAREAAMLDVGDWSYQLQYAVAEGRSRTAEAIGMVIDWLLILFGVFGAVQLARHRPKFFILILMPVIVVLGNVAFFYGSTRMRVAAEPSIVLFGVIGLVEAVSKVRRRPSFMPWRAEPADER